MPTAAKLIGAILFASLAYYVSIEIQRTLPGGAAMDWFALFNAGLGVAMGWRIIGRRAGDGFLAAAGYGLTTVVAITFWCLVVWSGYEMFQRAVHGRYDSPVDAFAAMGDLMLKYAGVMVQPEAIGAAVIGSLLCAMVTEYFSHRWA